jgi:hypothetical protein
MKVSQTSEKQNYQEEYSIFLSRSRKIRPFHQKFRKLSANDAKGKLIDRVVPF